jgi:hypothetical protein
LLSVPSRTDPEALADWAEASCLVQGNSASRFDVRDALEQAAIAEAEIATGNIWQNVDLRHRLAAGGHPIAVTPQRLAWIKNWKDYPAYAFMLILACIAYYPGIRTKRSTWIRAPKLFEYIANYAVEAYVAGKAVNIGHPRERKVPRPFGKCLEHISNQTREGLVSPPRFRLGIKDGNVDTIGWRPFNDERSGQVVILIQCAAGSDWQNKANDVSLREWRDYIDWMVEPLKGFAFPFVCLDSEQWRIISDRGGILLDRLRLASFFQGNHDLNLRKELVTWCTEILKQFGKLAVD